MCHTTPLIFYMNHHLFSQVCSMDSCILSTVSSALFIQVKSNIANNVIYTASMTSSSIVYPLIHAYSCDLCYVVIIFVLQ